MQGDFVIVKCEVWYHHVQAVRQCMITKEPSRAIVS